MWFWKASPSVSYALGAGIHGGGKIDMQRTTRFLAYGLLAAATLMMGVVLTNHISTAIHVHRLVASGSLLTTPEDSGGYLWLLLPILMIAVSAFAAVVRRYPLAALGGAFSLAIGTFFWIVQQASAAG